MEPASDAPSDLPPGTRPDDASSTEPSPSFRRRPVFDSGRRVLFRYAAFVLAALAILGGIQLFTWRDAVVQKSRAFSERAVQAFDLPAAERERVLGLLEHVLGGFERRELSDDQLRELFEELGKSPLAAALSLLPLRERFAAAPDLPQDERAGALDDLSRLVRGLLEGEVQRADVDGILAVVPRSGPESGVLDVSRLGRPELEEIAERLETALGEAGVSGDGSVGDVAGELRRVIERALGEGFLPAEEEEAAAAATTPAAP
jgi:hypothetical protein